MKGELSEKQIEAIKTTLRQDKRIELIPTRDGVKIYVCSRKELNTSRP